MLQREIVSVYSEIHTKHKCNVGRTQNFRMLKVSPRIIDSQTIRCSQGFLRRTWILFVTKAAFRLPSYFKFSVD